VQVLYTITLTDTETGCTTNATYEVPESTDIPIGIIAEVGPNCFGQTMSGGISIRQITGGLPPYTIQWDYEDATTYYLYDLENGNYCLTVTDNCGTTHEQCFTIFENPEIFIEETITHSCPEDELNAEIYKRGEIELDVSGGIPPYTYQWSVSGTSNYSSTIGGLTAGNYCVTVSDVNYCSKTKCFEITNYDLAIDVGNLQHCDNNDCSDAIIDLELSGNAANPFTIEWYAYLENLNYFTFTGNPLNAIPEPGTYYANVTDGAGCVYRRSFDIKNCSDVTSPTIDNAVVVPTSPVFPDGLIIVDVLPDENFYTYSWEGPGNFTTNSESLIPADGAGDYTITVLDGGCSENALTESYTIENCALDITVEEVISECSSEGFGRVLLRVANTDENDIFYFYQDNVWNQIFLAEYDEDTGSTLLDLNGFPGENYELSILNQNLCGGVVEFAIGVSNVDPIMVPFTLYQPLIGGTFLPVFCAEAVYCDGEPIRIINVTPYEIELITQSETVCGFDFSCGNPVFGPSLTGAFQGEVIHKIGAIGENCVGGRFLSLNLRFCRYRIGSSDG
jgi:hypothetical protein